MPFKIRVRNFQSVKDATLNIRGLTVITGPNNSGKSALMRAIRGVFTNAPAGSFVRHGEGSLTVDLTFEDGQTVTWEKGSEKPDGKGKAINRYTVNGKILDGVGRGVPPEVEALGVREISGGLWPQIAKQFDGTLFLVDKPGSVVAEALSDVERVGKLSDALRASESDRRTIASEIKVRRADEARLQARLAQFDGLSPVLDGIEALDLKSLQARANFLATLKQLAAKLRAARQDLSRYEGFTAANMPSEPSIDALRELLALRTRLENARKNAQDYNLHVEVPFFAFDLSGMVNLRRLAALFKTALKNVGGPKSFPAVPDMGKLDRYGPGIAKVREWRDRHKGLARDIRAADAALEQTREAHGLAVREAHEALHALGQCPTCGTGT